MNRFLLNIIKTNKIIQTTVLVAKNRSFSGDVTPPTPKNEPVLTFLPGSKERETLKKELERMSSIGAYDIPLVIGGKEIYTQERAQQLCPYNHKRVVANVSLAGESHIKKAIEAALAVRKEWDLTPFDIRAGVFLRAAELLSTKYRSEVLAATIIGQGKTAFQAEIDATCELIDFFKFGVQYAKEIYSSQPKLHSTGIWNRLVFRGLEGFIAAITPFNFTAIGGNVGATPALVGNVMLWKPSELATLSNWVVFKALRESGLPDGVVNFLPSTVPLYGDTVLSSPDLAGLSFTGSDKTFRKFWQQIGNNINRYKMFPRVIGETGGKNYHLVHESADSETVANCTIRSAFEFGGQKCSACARLYVPENLWNNGLKDRIVSLIKELKLSTPEDFTTFFSAVIDAKAFARISSYLNLAKESPNVEILAGGNCNDSIGYFVEPTLLVTKDPKHRLMQEEIFGPVITTYVYNPNDWDEVVSLVDTTSPYGLSGSIFSNNTKITEAALKSLRHSAGNFYINDKCTGSVVGQQPFGGSRASGTNDKSGAMPYVLRWTSWMSIKENFLPITTYDYPYMSEK